LLPFCSIDPSKFSVTSVATVVGEVALLASDPHPGSHATDNSPIPTVHAQRTTASLYFIEACFP
jgi:hypothetical protein